MRFVYRRLGEMTRGTCETKRVNNGGVLVAERAFHARPHEGRRSNGERVVATTTTTIGE